MELVGLDLPKFNAFFHSLGKVLFIGAAPRRRVDVSLKLPQMDEMACCKVSLKSRNVNGAYGLGFTPIQQLFS